ncbi:hypothetical protein BC828DRAFT_91499 [Blastocladiella britannica]|nr:hypothetical protein BC828DRAFT_91499 [Blastocladiella britannica]
MALPLLGLLGLAGPGWVMGVIADIGSAGGYAQEMYAAMLNVGALEDDRSHSCCLFQFIDVPTARPIQSVTRTSAWLFLSTWIISHVCSELLDAAHFGARLLSRAITKGVSVADALGHPGVGSGPCTAAATQNSYIMAFWIVARRFIRASPEYLHDVLSSDFFKIMAPCEQFSDEFALESTKAVADLCSLAGAADATPPTVALDFAMATATLFREPSPEHTPLVDMVGRLLEDPVAAWLIVEHMDAPDFYARAISGFGRHESAIALIKLLKLPNNVRDQSAYLTQCGRAFSAMGSWDMALDVVLDHEDFLCKMSRTT